MNTNLKTIGRKNEDDDWLTPPEIVRVLGDFDLDPCASRNAKSFHAKNNYLLPEQNGLLLPWSGRVWCNPPFGEMRSWVNRFYVHGNGMLLVPAWPGNSWFFQIWQHSQYIFFSRGGIKFIQGKTGITLSSSMHSIAIAAAGEQNEKVLPELRKVLDGAMVTSSKVFY